MSKKDSPPVSRPILMEDIKCPFCSEGGFDLVGLKLHLLRWCDAYAELSLHGHGIILSDFEATEAAKEEAR